jgi:hypothetical protein
MRTRLGRSPDLADALGTTFAPGGYRLPAVNLAPALDTMRLPSLPQRVTQQPGRGWPGAGRPVDPAAEAFVRQRWGMDDDPDAY